MMAESGEEMMAEGDGEMMAEGDGEMMESDASCAEDYVVQADDWLSKIAEKFYGDVLAYPTILKPPTRQPLPVAHTMLSLILTLSK